MHLAILRAADTLVSLGGLYKIHLMGNTRLWRKLLHSTLTSLDLKCR